VTAATEPPAEPLSPLPTPAQKPKPPQRPDPPEELSTWRFAKELWKFCPKDWLVEFFYKTQKREPTPQNPKGAPRIHIELMTVDHVLENYPRVDLGLLSWNSKGFNVHHSVNPRFQRPPKRGRNEDVKAYTTLWIDADWHTAPEAVVRARIETCRQEMRKKDLDASVVFESGYGLHLYWLLDKLFEAEPAETCRAREACAGLMDYFKISDAISDPSRVLRWPCTANFRMPGTYVWSRIAEASWKRYPIEAFDEYRLDPGATWEKLSEAEEKKRIAEEIERIGGSSAVAPSGNPKVEEYKLGVGEGGRNIAAASMAGHYLGRGLSLDAAWLLLTEWNKRNRPPLEEDELRLVFESMAKKDLRKREREAAAPSVTKEDLDALAKSGATTAVQATPADEPETKDKRGRPKKEKGTHQPWFDEEGNFVPQSMADYLLQSNKFLATPIGFDGKGVNLHLYWGGAYHAEDGADFARTEVHKLLGSGARMRRIQEAIDLLIETTKIHFRRINPKAKQFINLKNGMLDWKAGVLTEHSSDYLSTVQIPVEYDPKASCPALDKFFADVFPADAIPLVEEFMGYLLVPDTRYQKCFIAVGSGSNGKSTYLKILERFLGKDNTSSLTIHEIEEDRFALVNLVGKLANICHDLDPRMIESTGKFKRIVSGEALTAEDKFKSAFRFTPFARLIFAANEFPRATDKTDGYTRRLIFVPFTKVFSDVAGNKIPDYDVVLAETPGFMPTLLNRALAGLRRLHTQKGFTQCESVQKSVDRYKRDCNSALDFILEFCDFHANSWISRHDLYEPYQDWCTKEGMKPMSAKTFAGAARTIKGVFEHKNTVHGWKGLTWKDGQRPLTFSDEATQAADGLAGGKVSDTDF